MVIPDIDMSLRPSIHKNVTLAHVKSTARLNPIIVWPPYLVCKQTFINDYCWPDWIPPFPPAKDLRQEFCVFEKSRQKSNKFHLTPPQEK